MKKRVLLVDDDPGVRESIRKVLRAAGYEVTTAAGGEEAAVQFIPEETDLVLLDLNLPFCSGWDVFERLTAQHPSIPVIIITGMPNQYQTALAAGVGALIEKPIEVSSLLKAMDDLLGEPEEARLRRMCGYQSDTRHFPRPNTSAARRSPPPDTGFRQRRRPRGVIHWSEG